jgi:hypothetical protein
MKTKIKLKKRNIDFMICTLTEKVIFEDISKKERKTIKNILKKLGDYEDL